MTPRPNLTKRSRTRPGFTLFEVGISLVIVSVGVLSVMMLMPVGIKAQQMARFQILASAKAIEIMSVNANQWRKWDLQRMEGRTLGLCSINQVAQTPLIEQKMCNWRHGSLPVPVEIARRLDSDGDEIQNILAQGGYLFYASPRPIASDDEEVSASDESTKKEYSHLLENREISNESQRLVYAIVGNPQQPALASHPCKAWPYYDWHPTPPRARTVANTSSPNSRHEDSWRLNGWPAQAEFLAVNAAFVAARIPPPLSTDPMLTPAQINQLFLEQSREQIKAYRDKAKELVGALGMPVGINGIPDLPPGSAYDRVEAYKVLAAGYVAQAMVWLTSPSFWSTVTPTSAELAELADAQADAQKAHESALTWLRRHATTDPYDWGIDRAVSFQNGWDQPLLQYELFASANPTAGLASLFSVPTNGDVSWRVLSAQPVINAGASSSDKISTTRLSGNQSEIAASWGNANTFNLTKPFQPAERCRQLVFWAVDWKSYSDAETAPSAPQDASRTPYDSDNNFVYNAGAHKFNNPERFFTFENALRTSFANKTGNTKAEREIYLGMWGADRNGNRRLDVGPVPASVRMRAMSVSRFNVYQPRVWSGLRN